MTPTVAKYLTKPVPRYTSYPTAPHFSDRVDGDISGAWIGALEQEHPISLYLHVPFCKDLCWYCGCNMKLAKRDAPLVAYADTLLEEIALIKKALPARMTIDHLHWGGGTPTALRPEDLARVMAVLRRDFDFTTDAELAIEADPRTLTPDMAMQLGELGFNRASFGVQEFEPRVQAAINRVQPPEKVAACVAWLRAAGVSRLNFDLIYGLPHQTAESLEQTIELCADMGPDRFALFGYAHVPWMAAKQRLIPDAALPKGAERLEQAERAAAQLKALGYQAIGIDHFAKPDDPLAVAARRGTLSRNFQGYTTDAAQTLIGIGASSISRTPSGFTQNIVEPGAWGRAVRAGRLPTAKGHAYQGEDKVRAAIIEQLMCYGAVDLSATIASGIGSLENWEPAFEVLRALEEDGVIACDGPRISIKADAISLVRVVASAFDEYLRPDTQRHSVAV
jgi:oxygen-independent coproporphyrinogen-3 oxidase